MLPAFCRALCSVVLCGANCWSDVERRWVVSHVRVVRRGMDKRRSTWNAVSACTTISDEMLLGHSDDELLRVANGSGMKRVDKVGDVPLRPSSCENLKSLSQHVASACRCLQLRKKMAMMLGMPCFALLRVVPQGAAVLQCYTAGL